MTKLRYLIAGIIACLIQGMALSYAPKEKAISISMDQGVNAMQIQLLARAAAQAPKETQQPQKIKQPNVEETIVEQSEKPVLKPSMKEQTTAHKNIVEKPKPVKQPVSKPITKATPKATPKAAPKTVKPVEKKQPTDAKPTVAKANKKPVNEKAKPRATSEKVEKPTPPPKPVSTQTKIEKTSEPTTDISHHQASQNSEPMLVSKPQFSAKPVPVSYPKLARKRGLEGKTLIEVWLDSEGKQIKQKIIISSGHSILDNRALNTIKQWQFSRRIEQGQAIAHRVQIPINFKLR